MARKKAAPDPAFRCAIYTRKSTEEGLDQDFNTLDAQREAGEAYVQSQRGEGWEVVGTRYDDGGFTGANMDRPALQRLLADIQAGKVNAVVVYKVDRLSRSLLDFARIMEILDRQKVAFVSVTQSFNSATSMGRLTLNILLSFAQFERETIAERTSDKMCAARRKGKWVGGMPMLGYDVAPEGGKLLVNEEEACRVRDIFDLYLRKQSLIGTVADLNTRGWTTKTWVTKKGSLHAGAAFDKSRLHRLLSNVTYTGRVEHQGEIYEGEHEAVVDREVWQRAQATLRYNGKTGGKAVRNKFGALLKGLLRCVPCDTPMSHSITTKKTRRYRYYVCARAQKEGWASCPTKSLPAQEVERFVVERIKMIGQDPGLIADTIAQAKEQHAAELRRLEEDGKATEKDLRAFNEELQRVIEAPGRNGATADRLADLQDRIREDERRLGEIREKAIAASREVVDEEDLTTALSHFTPVWDALFPREQARILQLLVERVGYDGEKGTLALTFRPSGIRALAGETQPAGKEAH